MRYFLSALFFCLAGLLLGAAPASPTPAPITHAHFSPRGGCTDAAVNAIGGAKSSVFVQSYVLTSKPIAAALIAAKKRGAQVEVIADNKGSLMNGTQIPALIAAGVPVHIDARHPIAHNKTIIIDDGLTLTGSFNFTAQAEESNAENLLELYDTACTKAYKDNWNAHRAHCVVQPTTATSTTSQPQASTPPTPSPCASGRCTLPETVGRYRRR